MKFRAECRFTLVSFLFSSFLFIPFCFCIARISKRSIVLKSHIKCAQVYLLSFVCEFAKHNFAQVVLPRKCDFFLFDISLMTARKKSNDIFRARWSFFVVKTRDSNQPIQPKNTTQANGIHMSFPFMHIFFPFIFEGKGIFHPWKSRFFFRRNKRIKRFVKG